MSKRWQVLHLAAMVFLYLGRNLSMVPATVKPITVLVFQPMAGSLVSRLDAGIKELGVENAYFPCFVSQDRRMAMEGMYMGIYGNVRFRMLGQI